VVVWVCRYASVAALGDLGHIYREATDLIEHYYEAFYDETKLAATLQHVSASEEGVAALEKDLLVKRVAQPISEPLPVHSITVTITICASLCCSASSPLCDLAALIIRKGMLSCTVTQWACLAFKLSQPR